ncbi:MAG: RIP metalloprotease RseP [Acidobacteriota bacterium]
MLLFENLWWLIVMIGVMILVHELGHFCVARLFDVRIDVFSFGFGPRLFGFRRGETDYRFSLILLGGYVKMAGEQPRDETANDPRAFLAKPRWQRLMIAGAGPAMNIVLAVTLLTGLFMVKHQRPADQDQRAVIGHVFPDTAAARAGLRAGDLIVRIDDAGDPNWEDVVLKEVSSAQRPLQVKVEREGKQFWVTVTPVIEERSGLGFAGWAEDRDVQLADVSPGMPAEKAGLRAGDILLTVEGKPIRSVYRLHEIVRGTGGKEVTIEYSRQERAAAVTVKPVFAGLDGPPRWMIGVSPAHRLITSRLSFPAALRESVRHNLKNATLIYRFLKGIIERRLSPRSIEGPIGIARLSGDAAREGAPAFLVLMAIVSLNLAVFNLLPIPILDGGVILLLVVEMLLGRDLSLAVKETVFKLGLVFLMVVVAFVLYNDISKMLPG